MQRSNLAILTQSHKAIAAKKRAKKDQVKEILFDEDARREFLTGFHKRKVAKHEAAKKKAQLREKEERLETRREHRRMLAERAVQNAKEVEKAYGAIIDGDDDETEWDGISNQGKDQEVEEAFEDEEQLATVTVVEDFDPSVLIHGPEKTRSLSPSTLASNTFTAAKPKGKEKAKGDPVKLKNKVKKNDKVKKIKYQTKAARLAERSKQRARRTEKAERAGGKASRKGKRR
ncbi:nucleolar protein 12-domain-containing protein [Hygrophoropsis aurantiaca]|uniref:Nucleolar protein 12-domain-containing protein n=1 Tax=Hygrophoropsis aurantiaca TaxID=72124 RepID=A0ACB7ZWP9_9AGAM|nr:nucleolar protein 12-domain-containing protein [Hygrophoropsis aurantiaca]